MNDDDDAESNSPQLEKASSHDTLSDLFGLFEGAWRSSRLAE